MAKFQILLCSDLNQYVIADSGGETLSIGEIWSFSGSSGELICGSVISSSDGDAFFSASTNFDSCGECLESTLTFVSAGTPYEECLVCYTASGYTATSVAVPHPVWTGPNGQVVTQMSAVQLGGMNGLYS
jgi:hypothetical protein